jgi:hypothetical protein
MQDRLPPARRTSCNARPDHTLGSNSEELSTSICFPLHPQTRTLLDTLGTSQKCQRKQGLRCPVAAFEARQLPVLLESPGKRQPARWLQYQEKSKNRYVREEEIICVMFVTYTGGSFSRYSLAHEHRVVPTTQRKESYHEQEPYRQDARTDGRGT